MDSSILFYSRDVENHHAKYKEKMAYLSVQHPIILAQCRAEDNIRGVLKIVNPLPLPKTVSSHLDHADPKGHLSVLVGMLAKAVHTALLVC